jgi:ABC-2 type transport system ATP-binding protein
MGQTTFNHADDSAVPRPLVHVQQLSKTYGSFSALSGVTFSVRSGELLGLIGPNGAGKTTLFECLAGVQPFDSGEITFPFGGAQRPPKSSILFYVPDGITPWPDQTVGWALQFGIGFFGGLQDLYPDIVRELSLGELLHVRIRALSKGQRKRFLLGLGLLMPQRVLLIDEPFEGLDLRQSREVAAVLRKFVDKGRTIFVSIHQIADAAKICDRFVLLSNGFVVAEGKLDELTSLAERKQASTSLGDFEEVFLALT